MKIIHIASLNPVKIKATAEGFRQMFPDEIFTVIPCDVNPGIVSQPIGDAETLDGAERRTRALREQFPSSDYWVGIEGGVTDRKEGMGTFAWVVIMSIDCIGRGRSGEFFLPKKVAELVHQGMELGDADDVVFSRNNSKQGNGAVGILTADVINREQLYVPAVVFALIPYKNPGLFQ